ncbi:GTP 3',8-cyclase MoaA [Desulfatiferula olefinivorans]
MNDKAHGTLVDRYNRTLNYLRISVTDKCNLRCIYCVSHEPYPKLSHSDILRYEEILRLVRVGVRLGINKIRVTGGEPLVRRGITDFLERLTAVPGLDDVSLTTNGILLSDHLSQIRRAGITRLNISLDSMKPERFRAITGHDGFDRVWAAIMQALDMGFSPIKINVVALPGINEDELADFARLTLTLPLHVRFIEYMPIGHPELDPRRNLLTPDIRNIIETVGPLDPVVSDRLDGPARRFRIRGALGEVGLISPVSDHFCKTCNRIRLTADGRLRLCLLSDETLSIAPVLRSGADDEALAALFRTAARIKHEKHALGQGTAPGPHDVMASIGG